MTIFSKLPPTKTIYSAWITLTDRALFETELGTSSYGRLFLLGLFCFFERLCQYGAWDGWKQFHSFLRGKCTCEGRLQKEL